MKTFLYWLPMVVLAFVNAGFREGVLVKHLPAMRAHQWSTVILSRLCLGYTALVFGRLGIAGVRQALLTGAVWVLLTVAFEFGLGRAMQKPWGELPQNYRVGKGYLLPLFLAVLGLAPWLFYRLLQA